MSKNEYERLNTNQKHNEWQMAKALQFEKEFQYGRIKVVRK